MLDTFLNWFSISVPLLFALVANILALKLPSERHYKKFVGASILLALLFSGIIWWQQTRAAKQAELDRNNAITETADNTAKRVKADYEPVIAKQNAKIDALQKSLDAQGKDVVQIGQSPFVRGTKPVPVEVTNPDSSPAPAHQGHLTVTQTRETSTRLEYPYRLKVVVQSDIDFPSLKFKLDCNGPIGEIEGGIRSTLYITYNGLNPQNRFQWMFGYVNASPSFGPSTPIIADIYAANPIACGHASTD
jgi:hypothetical protein